MDIRVALLQREDQACIDKINALYWTFTRCARGKPPAVVRPDLYARRKEIAAMLAEIRRRSRLA